MNTTAGRPTVRRPLLPPWLTTGNRTVRLLRNLLVAIVVGLVLGEQIAHPQGRFIKALVGIFVLYAAWKFPIPVSLSAFVLLFMYPFPTVYASSNTIFVFLITAMWLAHLVLRTARPAGRTMLDLPILLLLGIYLLSFNSVNYAEALKYGLINLSTIIASIFVYYLIVSSVRDEESLRRMMKIILIMAASTWFCAIWELALPGRPIVPGWILSGAYYDPETIQKGLRVGGPLQDFELFAEFNAMMLPIMFFQFGQSKGARERFFWFAGILLNFFVLMSTVTRGATIAFLVASIYMLIMLRKNMRFEQYILTIASAVAIWAGIEFYLSTYTVSGSVIERLLNTKIVDGLPDSRTFWPDIFARAMEKPWVGHGPYYEFGIHGREKLAKFFWPHNGYLYYLHTVGILGTAAFVWILWRLLSNSFKWSRHQLGGNDYASSLLFAWHISLVTFMVDQTKIEYLRSPHYQFWPWIVFGMMVVNINVVRQMRGEAAPRSAPGASGESPAERRPWQRRFPQRRGERPAENANVVLVPPGGGA